MAVTPADVAVELGRPTPSTDLSGQWSTWIDQARFLLRFGDGAHAGLGNLDLLDQEAVDYVVLQAVAAHVRRPDDSTQVDVAVDDGRVSRRYESGKGRVTILDGSGAGGAFTITPFSAPDARLNDSTDPGAWWV